MADTRRTIAELLALLADNTTGDISPQDMRDVLVSLGSTLLALEDPGWEDLTAPLTTVKVAGANQPTWTAFLGAGGLFQWAFTKGDEIFIVLHSPHKMDPNTKFYPHVHWTTDGVDTGVVAWDIEYSIAQGHDQEGFQPATTFTISEAASGSAWQHMITEASEGQAITIVEPDTLIIVRLERNNTATDTCSDVVFGLEFDLHYQVDRIATLNKAPDFYA